MVEYHFNFNLILIYRGILNITISYYKLVNQTKTRINFKISAHESPALLPALFNNIIRQH